MRWKTVRDKGKPRGRKGRRGEELDNPLLSAKIPRKRRKKVKIAGMSLFFFSLS